MPRSRHYAALALVPSLALAQDASVATAEAPVNVRVSAHVLLLDRGALDRAGLEVLQVGDGRLRVARRGGVAAEGDVAGMPVAAFIGLARERRLLRSESRMLVVVASGSRGRVSGATLGADRRGLAREAGPELHVVPTLLADGRIRLEVGAGLRDVRQVVHGDMVDASPAMATTTLVVRPGVEATVGTIGLATERRDAGMLHWRREREQTDAVIVLAAEATPR